MHRVVRPEHGCSRVDLAEAQPLEARQGALVLEGLAGPQELEPEAVASVEAAAQGRQVLAVQEERQALAHWEAAKGQPEVAQIRP